MGIETEVINEEYLGACADIPECRPRDDIDAEYRDFPEEQIWTPKEEVNKWVPLYVSMARSILTFAQENQGISNREAMENSCTGYAEQYITDVLHDSEYLPEVALKTLLTKELPQKLIAKWTATDVELFVQGIERHGKNFSSIRKNLLPAKETKDLVDFYYAWKMQSSENAKQLKHCHRRRRSANKRHSSSNDGNFGALGSPKIVTRSATAALRNSLDKNEEIPKTKAAESPEVSGKRKRKSFRAVR